MFEGKRNIRKMSTEGIADKEVGWWPEKYAGLDKAIVDVVKS